MNYTEQLELEAEHRRRQLSASLDELRDRFSPGQVVDQLVEYVQDSSGGQFFHNLRRQVVGNPLPVTLIGAGVAWLVMANGRGRNGNGRVHYDYDRSHGDRHEPGHRNAGMRRALGKATDTISDTGADMAARARAAASSLGESADDLRTRFDENRERLQETAQSSLSSVRETARETYGEIYDAASDVYERASERAAGMGTSIADFCREQPLVVAGIGIALGAALGAALPASELENRMMGDASDGAKRKAREIASDALDKAEAVGERVAEAATDEAREQGLTEPLEGKSDAADERDADDAAGLPGNAPLDTVTVVPDPDPAQPADRSSRSG